MEVFCYGNVDTLRAILHAVVMVVGADAFRGLLSIAVLLGFLIVAIKLSILQGWRPLSWLATTAIIGSVVLSPRADVILIDKLGVQPTTVVANVPVLLGLVVSVKSQIGHQLTNLTETAFQTLPFGTPLPAQLTYADHGVLWGSRLIRRAGESAILDPNLNADVINYIRNCALPVINKPAFYTAEQFVKAQDLWQLISNSNKALFTGYWQGNTQQVAPCPDVWNILDARMAPEMGKVLNRLAAYVYPGETVSVTAPKVADELLAAANRAAIGGAAADASRLLLQVAMIKATSDAHKLIAITSGNTSALLAGMAQAQAYASANMSSVTEAFLAEEAVPILRNILEAILIALFPVMVLLLIASEGEALKMAAKGYLFTMMWVELWPVTFAILNFIATTRQMAEIAGAAYLEPGVSGWTLNTAANIYQAALSGSAIAGRMTVMVPAITGAMLFGMSRLSGMFGPREAVPGNPQAQADAASKGNINGGNVSLEQVTLSPMRGAALAAHVSTMAGEGWTRVDGAGPGVWQARKSGALLEMANVQSLTQEAARDYSDAKRATDSKLRDYQQSWDAATRDVVALAKSSGRGTKLSDGTSIADLGNNGLTNSEVRQSAEAIARRFGVSDSNQLQRVLEGGVSGQAGTPSAIQNLFGLSANASVRATGRTESGLSLEDALSQSSEQLRHTSQSRQQDLRHQFQTSREFESVRSSNVEASKRIEAAYAKTDTYREAASQIMSREEIAARRLALRSSNMEEIRLHGTQYFMQWAERTGNVHTALTGDAATQARLAQQFIDDGALYVNPATGEKNWSFKIGENPFKVLPDAPMMGPGWTPVYMPDGSEATLRKVRQANAAFIEAATRGQGLGTPGAAVGPGALAADVAARRAGVESDLRQRGYDLDFKEGAVRQSAKDRATGPDAISARNQTEVYLGRDQMQGIRGTHNIGNDVFRGAPPVPTAPPTSEIPGGWKEPAKPADSKGKQQ
jgi:conjugal transfer mating pair stabilization protein TraG